MSDCGHLALIASGEARGLCPLCQRVEIERLQEWRVLHPYSEVDMDMHVEAVTKELRAENERLRIENTRLTADLRERRYLARAK